MYTVIRFTSETLASCEFDRLGAALNTLVPGAFTGMRYAGDGFACEVSDAPRWEEQQAAILAFIQSAAPAIASAVESGVQVCVDAAIEPADLQAESVVCISFTPALTSCAAAAGVTLAFTVYGGGGVLPLGNTKRPSSPLQANELK